MRTFQILINKELTELLFDSASDVFQAIREIKKSGISEVTFITTLNKKL